METTKNQSGAAQVISFTLFVGNPVCVASHRDGESDIKHTITLNSFTLVNGNPYWECEIDGEVKAGNGTGYDLSPGCRMSVPSKLKLQYSDRDAQYHPTFLFCMPEGYQVNSKAYYSQKRTAA